jgi:uncharacterized protein YgbK (DUF1537 family)
MNDDEEPDRLALGIHSVDVAAAFIPGAPLCRAHAPGCPANGLEVVFKGGSLAPEDLLVRVAGPCRIGWQPDLSQTFER